MIYNYLLIFLAINLIGCTKYEKEIEKQQRMIKRLENRIDDYREYLDNCNQRLNNLQTEKWYELIYSDEDINYKFDSLIDQRAREYIEMITREFMDKRIYDEWYFTTGEKFKELINELMSYRGLIYRDEYFRVDTLIIETSDTSQYDILYKWLWIKFEAENE